MTLRRQIFMWCSISMCGAILVNGIDVFAQWFAVSRNGSDEILWDIMWLLFPFFFAFVMIFVSIVLLIFRKTRKTALLALLASLTYLIVSFGMFDIGWQVRRYGFHRLAERSVPLVQAIRRFENEKGHPPNSLKDLIPEYLHSIPDTGMGAYPNYKYIVGEESRKRWDNNPWVLYIDTPSGGINWDMFMYFPNQNYPKRGYGGDLEQIGYWAYVHE